MVCHNFCFYALDSTYVYRLFDLQLLFDLITKLHLIYLKPGVRDCKFLFYFGTHEYREKFTKINNCDERT